MTVHPNDNVARKVNDAKRTNSPLSWAIGAVFLLPLLGTLFFYDGRDLNFKPGSSLANTVNSPTGVK